MAAAEGKPMVAFRSSQTAFGGGLLFKFEHRSGGCGRTGRDRGARDMMRVGHDPLSRPDIFKGRAP